MNIPKEVVLSGKCYKIKQKKGMKGGSGDTLSKVIEIGVGVDDQDKLETLCHEYFEVICMERNLRYALERPDKDNGDYCFIMSHEQMEQAVKDFALAIRGLING